MIANIKVILVSEQNDVRDKPVTQCMDDSETSLVPCMEGKKPDNDQFVKQNIYF